MKIFYIACALLALLVMPVYGWAQAAQQGPASQMIQDIGNKAIAIAADKSQSNAQRDKKYDDLLRSAFDIPTIGHFVLGRYWNIFSPDQQQQFLKVFEELIIKVYSSRINFYSGEGFKVLGERAEDDRDVIVNSQISHPDGSKPTEVDWRVRNGAKPLIIDVSVEGVSQSITERQEYASILQQNDGKLEPLLALMQQQINGQSQTAVNSK